MNGTRRELFTEYVDHNFVPVSHSTSPSKRPLADEEHIRDVLNSKDLKKIKALVRENSWPVDHGVRKVLWTELSKARHDVKGDVYHEMVQQSAQGSSLPSFVDQQYLVSYQLNSSGQQVARRVLGALRHACPDIVYCPALYPTTCLLLHFMAEVDAFNCLYAMVRSPKCGYLAQTKMSYTAGGYVLRDLAKKYAKPTYSIIAKKFPNKTESVFADWLWWILNHLPFAYLVRVFDCYLVEGIKVFYRVALAMLLLFNKLAGKQRSGDSEMEPELVAAVCGCLTMKASPQKSVAEHIQTALNQFSEDMPVPIEKLLKFDSYQESTLRVIEHLTTDLVNFETAFNIRGFQRKEIDKLQVKNEMILQSLRHVVDNAKSASCESLDRHGDPGAHIELTAAVDSGIIGNHEFQTIWQWLPVRMTCYHPTLLYTTDEHGTSLRTMFQRCEDRDIPATIILVKTADGEVFGAYCSADWVERKQHKRALAYFGTGESFVFTVKPHVKRYEWVGVGKANVSDIPSNSHMFQAASDKQLTIGGGDGEAIRLDEELREGLTEHCATFDNPPLAQKKHFTCTTLEVIGFT